MTKNSNIIDGKFFFDKKQEIISISPSIDILLGGGVTAGWHTIYGPPKFGKTSLALYIAKKCQDKGRHVFYDNVEGRLKPRDLLGIANLDPTKFHVISSQGAEINDKGEVTKPAKILTAEEHLTECENVLRDHPRCVLIIDSESYLCTEAEITAGMADMQRADAAKLMAKFVRRTTNLIALNDCIVIVIRHISANPTGYGAPTKEKGSNAGSYQADVKLKGEKLEKWQTSTTDDKSIGQILTWKLEHGSLERAIPNTTIKSYLRYGHGIDENFEIASMAIEFGLAVQKGAWVTLGDKKFNGTTKFADAISNDEELKTGIWKQIRELVGL